MIKDAFSRSILLYKSEVGMKNVAVERSPGRSRHFRDVFSILETFPLSFPFFHFSLRLIDVGFAISTGGSEVNSQ